MQLISESLGIEFGADTGDRFKLGVLKQETKYLFRSMALSTMVVAIDEPIVNLLGYVGLIWVRLP